MKLREWYLSKWENSDISIAWGIVSGHHRLMDGHHIHTSKIERLELKEDEKRLMMYTHSGSIYCLDWQDIHLGQVESTQVILKEFRISTDFLSACVELVKKAEEKTLAQADSILKNGELLLTFGYEQAFFKNSEGIVRKIDISVHVGMFQDSVLVTDWENHEVDFRYFPSGLFGIRIEPYHWSDGLEAVLIDNQTREEIDFIGSEKGTQCKVGEITRIKKEGASC